MNDEDETDWMMQWILLLLLWSHVANFKLQVAKGGGSALPALEIYAGPASRDASFADGNTRYVSVAI